MKVGDRAVLEYRMANTHYWPGTITEVTPGQRLATIELDEKPGILTTKILRVETKYLFTRHRPNP
jgi:hypothetical protein